MVDVGKSFLRMDIENSTSKQSARERLGMDKPSSTKIGVVSSKTASKTRTAVSTTQVVLSFVLVTTGIHFLKLQTRPSYKNDSLGRHR